MYRGQDIGSRDELIGKCVAVLREGEPEALFGILPHISLTRAETYCPFLVELLLGDTRDRQIFAAIALGSLCDQRAVAPLSKALDRPRNFRGEATQSLQKAVIMALGETGQKAALPPLLRLFHWSCPGDLFRKQRRELIITAVGTLAQFEIPEAHEALLDFAVCDDPGIRARAIAELGVVAWRLKSVPDVWVDLARWLLLDPDEEVQYAAWGALENWADLGCGKAQDFLGAVMAAVPA